MDKKEIYKLVNLITEAKRDKVADADIARQLISAGVPEAETSSLIECVVSGFRSGVNSVITGGLSSESYASGENPFFDQAFRRGKAVMRFTTPFWVLMRFVAPFIIGAAIALTGVILWSVLR